MNIYNGENLKNEGIFSCVKNAFQDGNLEKVCIFSGKGAMDF